MTAVESQEPVAWAIFIDGHIEDHTTDRNLAEGWKDACIDVVSLYRRPAEQPAPVVAPLAWSEPAPPCDSCRYDHVTAETPLGTYSIEWKGWKDYDSRTIYLDGEHLGDQVSLDAAKLFVESHFREKVAACLVASKPAPVSGVSEDVIKFAIQVEKALCKALGRDWSAAGISIESLIAELAAPVSHLKIGSGVTIENIGMLPDGSDRKAYFVFGDGVHLSEVNLVDVSLVSSRMKYTVEQLESIGVQLQPAPVAVVIYQTQYLGDGGGGWCDVEREEYERDSKRQDYRTRTVACLDKVKELNL